MTKITLEMPDEATLGFIEDFNKPDSKLSKVLVFYTVTKLKQIKQKRKFRTVIVDSNWVTQFLSAAKILDKLQRKIGGARGYFTYDGVGQTLKIKTKLSKEEIIEFIRECEEEYK